MSSDSICHAGNSVLAHIHVMWAGAELYIPRLEVYCMENEIVPVEADLISIQDEFEADIVLFSELDAQAQNEVKILSEYGYMVVPVQVQE